MAKRNLGRSEAAVSDWLKALPLYEELDDRDGLTRVCAASCYPLFLLDRLEEALELAEKGLTAAGERPTQARCRMLAQAGFVNGLKDYRLGLEFVQRAEELAATLGDSTLEAEVLSLKALFFQTYLDVWEEAECAGRATKLLEPTTELWWKADALNWRLLGLIMLGRLEEAARVAPELDAVASQVGNATVLRNVHVARTAIAWFGGELDRIAESLTRTIEATREARVYTWFCDLGLHGLLEVYRGRIKTGFDKLERAVKLDPCVGPYDGYTPGMLFAAKAYASHPDALAFLQKEVPLPKTGDTNFSEALRLGYAIEGLGVLGENTRAAELYPRASALADRVVMVIHAGLMTQTVAGIAAAAGGQWDQAVEHFETSLRQAHEIPHELEQPQVRYWYATMLRDRDAPGDREKARQLLGEALEAYEQVDFPRHREMAKELLGRL